MKDKVRHFGPVLFQDLFWEKRPIGQQELHPAKEA